MKDYKECTNEEFESAMAKKDNDPETLTNAELYIIKTKMEADMSSLYHANTPYANGLYTRTKRRFDAVDKELRDRMYGVKPSIYQ